MSLIFSDESAFEGYFGSPDESLSFTTLLDGSRRVDALILQQLLHPTQPELTVIKSIFGKNVIDIYTHSFDLDGWEIGSTNTNIGSRLPAVRWNYDLSISKLPTHTYLWIITPTSAPFSMETSEGFRGVAPENNTERTYFFSEPFSVESISFGYTGDLEYAPAQWQGADAMWRGEYVTW